MAVGTVGDVEMGVDLSCSSFSIVLSVSIRAIQAGSLGLGLGVIFVMTCCLGYEEKRKRVE